MKNRPLIPLFLAAAAGIIAGHNLHEYLRPAGVYLWFPPSLFILMAALDRPRVRIWLVCGIFSAGMMLDFSLHRPSLLTDLAHLRGTHPIEATVCEPVTDRTRYRRTTILIHTVFVDELPVKIEEYAALRMYGEVPDIKPGDGLKLLGRLSPFRNFNNPGGYDYAGAMALKGIACNVYTRGGRVLEKTGAGRLPAASSLIEKIRGPVRNFHTTVLSPGEPRALLRALVLGERHELTRDLRGSFTRTGLGHVLAVSGLHIGLVGWISFILAAKIMSASYRLSVAVVTARWAAFLSIFPVFLYTCLAGFQISGRRAMIMACVYLAAVCIGRRKDLWSTLAVAGLIIILFDPHSLFTISFQLSFTSVAAIVWLAPPLMKSAEPVINSVREGIPRTVASYITGLIVLSLVVTVFLAPLMAHYFSRLSLVALPANVTVVPLLGMVVVPLGLLSAVLCPAFPSLAALLARAAEAAVQAMIALVRFWDSFRYTELYVPTPNRWEVLLLYALLCLAVLSLKHRKARGALLLATAIFAADAGYWIHRVRFNSDMRVTFLDVGHGNSALLEMPGGRRMLVDGGGFPGGGFDTGEMLVAPFLRSRKIMSVERIVLSHPHTDHMGGLDFIARHFSPKEFWHSGMSSPLPSFQKLIETMVAAGTPIRAPPELPEIIRINGVAIDLLHPRAFPVQSTDSSTVNNNSLVMRVCFEGTCILLAGDIEKETEALLATEKAHLLQSRILLVPHHGAESSGTRPFLEMVAPAACIISARTSGHPSVTSRLEALGIQVFRTSENGAVEVKVNRNGYRIKTFLPVSSLLTAPQTTG